MISLIPVGLRRRILFTDHQLYDARLAPPTMIFPSLCIAKDQGSCPPGNQAPPALNPVSMTPSVLRRVIPFVSCPAAIILPSACTAKARTLIGVNDVNAETLKELSLDPSVFRRAI